MKLYILILFTLVIQTIHAAEIPGGFDEDALRKKYAHLYTARLIENRDGSVSFDKARLFQKHGINVLYLKGDQFEMGYQHGVLLRDQIVDGAAIQSSKLIPNTVRNAVGEGLLARVVTFGIDRFIAQPMLEHTLEADPAHREAFLAAFALSEATGIPIKTYVDGVLAPEILMVLAKLSMQFGKFPIDLGGLVGNCSAFTVWGPYAKDGQLVIGRNLDFPLTGKFDKHATLLYFDSTDGGQRYLSVASAGTHNVPITAINESGIYLALHTLPTPQAAAKAVPLFLTGGKVLRNAKTFDEALSILKSTPAPTGWTYDLISTREGRVGSVEITNQHVELRESTNGYHVQTNHFLTPNLQANGMLFINQSVDADTFARYNRAEKLIQSRQGRFDKHSAAQALGDQVDPTTGQTRGVGNTLAVHTTVSSVVVVPSEEQVYVAKGLTPVSHNGYVSFPLPGKFDPNTFAEWNSQTLAASTFATEHPNLAKAEKLFIKAKERFEYDNDSRGAWQLLNEIVALDASNPNYFFIQGILALRIEQLDDGMKSMEQLLKIASWDHQKHLARYYRARILGAQGKSEQAVSELDALIAVSSVDSKLKAAAEGLRRKLAFYETVPIKLSTLPLMMQQADMEHY